MYRAASCLLEVIECTEHGYSVEWVVISVYECMDPLEAVVGLVIEVKDKHVAPFSPRLYSMHHDYHSVCPIGMN
jgi:hypothetical protein